MLEKTSGDSTGSLGGRLAMLAAAGCPRERYQNRNGRNRSTVRIEYRCGSAEDAALQLVVRNREAKLPDFLQEIAHLVGIPHSAEGA